MLGYHVLPLLSAEQSSVESELLLSNRYGKFQGWNSLFLLWTQWSNWSIGLMYNSVSMTFKNIGGLSGLSGHIEQYLIHVDYSLENTVYDQ